jgi:hypothetical protein
MASVHQAPIDVVWNRQDITQALESQFFHGLLTRGTGRPIRLHFSEGDGPFRDDLLVVVLGADRSNHLAELRRRGHRNIGLFHMGDEKANHDLSFYGHADYVIRHYHFPHIVRPAPPVGEAPVLWVPNGYRDGVGPKPRGALLPASDRATFSFFAGMVSGESAPARRAMIDVIQTRQLPCALFGTRGFGGGFSPTEYAGRLENSVFGLVPMGNSVETIRLYDCLELGTIPVMLKADFLAAADGLDGVPFPVLDRWEDLEPLFRPLVDRADPAVRARLDAWQRDIVNWWSLVKERKAAEIARLVLGRR